MLKPFGFYSMLFMVVLGAALLALPLVLPPLPPPPMALLLVPVLIMSLLVMLALSPSHIPDVIGASSGEKKLHGLVLDEQKDGQAAAKQYRLRQPFTSSVQVGMHAENQNPEFYFRV